MHEYRPTHLARVGYNNDMVVESWPEPRRTVRQLFIEKLSYTQGNLSHTDVLNDLRDLQAVHSRHGYVPDGLRHTSL